MGFKQFGYRAGVVYDKSYCIEEVSGMYNVTIEVIPRSGRRTSGTPIRVIRDRFYLLTAAQAFVSGKHQSFS